jgi:hypothetical protein
MSCLGAANRGLGLGFAFALRFVVPVIIVHLNYLIVIYATLAV